MATYWSDPATFWDDPTLASTWSDLTGTISIASASSSTTNFPEAYPNRIPEDVYDSLGLLTMTFWDDTTYGWNDPVHTWGDPSQFTFVFSPNGPSFHP